MGETLGILFPSSWRGGRLKISCSRWGAPSAVSRTPFNQIFVRGHANDPPTAALSARGAAKSTQHGCLMLGVDGALQVSSSSKDYEFRTLPARSAQVQGIHYCRMGIRLSPNAGSGCPNEATSARCAPPDLRKVSVREPIAAPSAPGQAGYPPTMNSGATLGFCYVGNQSAEVAFGSFDDDRCALIRRVGTTPPNSHGKST